MDTQKAKYFLMAQTKIAPEEDRELMTRAQVIDPDAWRLDKLQHVIDRRIRSLSAASRLMAHDEALRAVEMATWAPEPQPPKWFSRLFALLPFGAAQAARKEMREALTAAQEPAT